jgi:hypothetical protein
MKRQVLVSAVPGANEAPSGAVISEMNCAWSQTVAACATGTDCPINNPANKTMLNNFCLNMESLLQGLAKPTETLQLRCQFIIALSALALPINFNAKIPEILL